MTLRSLPLLLGACLWLFCAGGAGAQLVWRSLDAAPRASLADEVVKTSFAFTNPGKKPVTITEVRTSCGCLSAVASPMVVPAGGKGKVAVSFLVGERTGPQEGTVFVATDADSAGPVALSFATSIPTLLEADPFLVAWERNSGPDAQEVRVTVAPEFPVHVVGVRAEPEGAPFKWEIVTEEPGRVYVLRVWPSATDTPAKAALWLQTDFPSKGKGREIPVYALVK